MATLLSFTSDSFDPSEEPENPINPIAGYALLNWAANLLEAKGYSTTRPAEPEDWGWYIYVESEGVHYLVGSCDQSEPREGKVDWLIQVHKTRSFVDKLRGRNLLTADDPITRALEEILGKSEGIEELEIEYDA